MCVYDSLHLFTSCDLTGVPQEPQKNVCVHVVVQFRWFHSAIELIGLHQNTGQRAAVLLMRLCHLQLDATDLCLRRNCININGHGRV